MDRRIQRICDRLNIDESQFVEIECKRRLSSAKVDAVTRFFQKRRGSRGLPRRSFFDQFLDTSSFDLLKAHASLRLRYKNNGQTVYLQYKGPGYRKGNLLIRSEYSFHDPELLHVEEEHADIIVPPTIDLNEVFRHPGNQVMREAMVRQLGKRVINRIRVCPIFTQYHKKKYRFRVDDVTFEPSIDQCMTISIDRKGIHPIATFFEVEVEVKSRNGSLAAKLDHLDDLTAFDRQMSKKFGLKPEKLDKYARCATYFLER
jgi:inorganic triphosphatase YgiF